MLSSICQPCKFSAILSRKTCLEKSMHCFWLSAWSAMLGLGRCLQGRASDSPYAVPVSVDCLSSHMFPSAALSFDSHESESVQPIYSLDLSIVSKTFTWRVWAVWLGSLAQSTFSMCLDHLVMMEVPIRPCGLIVCALKIQLVEATAVNCCKSLGLVHFPGKSYWRLRVHPVNGLGESGYVYLC